MPMHDWTRVEAGIFHAFHHEWISEISRALNRELLPGAYYALPEQVAAGFGPDVLTLQGQPPGEALSADGAGGTATALQNRPRTRFTAETDAEFCRRKKARLSCGTSAATASLPCSKSCPQATNRAGMLSGPSWRRRVSCSNTGFICRSSIRSRPARETRTAFTPPFGGDS